MPSCRVALLAVLGVVLVAGTPLTVPAEDTTERVYTYEAETAGEPDSSQLAECGWHPMRSHECAVARYLADGNTIALDAETGVSRHFGAEYEFVDVPEGYYRPVSTVENHTVVLGMEPVSFETVQRELASDADEWPAAVSAIENGTGTTTEKLPRTYLEHDGEFYQLRLHETADRETNPLKRILPDWSVGPVRSLGYLGGFAALWYSGVAYGRRE
ncbi:hypothetical protein ACFQMA_14500 [Halosimplex aquaticum]|uniref:Uncharacterized protein n=1 Tax=Halosimplex aquaticum TaxID=3026162 RepID=A0ABD5Y291_9EURY|nr:hypothetical protein [Halosimplex aquaticum]